MTGWCSLCLSRLTLASSDSDGIDNPVDFCLDIDDLVRTTFVQFSMLHVMVRTSNGRSGEESSEQSLGEHFERFSVIVIGDVVVIDSLSRDVFVCWFPGGWS